MDFVTRAGGCEVVSAEDAGERLQRFAARAFREQLLLRGDTRAQAHLAASERRLLVNDAVRMGGHALAAGDVVTLAPPVGELAHRAEPRRMALALDAADADADADADALADDARLALGATAGARAFKAYYGAQALCAPDAWEAAFARLLCPLPLSVRLNRATDLAGLAARAFVAAAAAAGCATRPVPWLAADEASQLAPAGLGGGDTGAGAAAALGALVSRAAAAGELCQQEAASMLPAALLAPVGRGDRVLDLCAAPGSKSSQLLDMLVAAARGVGGADGREDGFFVANDLERVRAERALRRLWAQPSAAAVVTCADASAFAPPAVGGVAVRFDRVLVDAPCSGDGTVRKNPGKWARWSAAPGCANHALQLRILARALALLAPGGRLVYSTCSLNPLECEAVVGAALRAANADGAPAEYALCSAADALPPGARATLTAGLNHWLVPLKGARSDWPAAEGGWTRVATHAEAEAALAGSATPPPPRSCFPAHAPRADGGADGGGADLRLCARVLPTAADCGAFFSALIRRADAPPAPAQPPSPPEAARARDERADADADADAWFVRLRALDAAADVELRGFFGLERAREEARGARTDARVQELAVCLTDALRAALRAEAAAAATAPTADGGGKRARGADALVSLVVSVAPVLLGLRHASGLAGAAASAPDASVLGGGLPLFARMPAGCDWPPERPWRACQQAARALGRTATRRVLALPAREYLAFLRARRAAGLDALARDGRLRGWDSCASADGRAEAGAVVVGVCAAREGSTEDAAAAAIERDGLFVAAVLARDASGGEGALELRLLASAEVTARYEELAATLAEAERDAGG